MKKKIFSFVFATACLFVVVKVNSQNFWSGPTGAMHLSSAAFIEAIDQHSDSIMLPLPDGGSIPFSFEDKGLLPANLSLNYGILALEGLCSLDKSTTATITIFENKLYGAIKFNDKTVQINPIKGTEEYQVSWVQHVGDNNFNCAHTPEEITNALSTARINAVPTTNRTRNYIIAFATTGEYALFHGGTKAKALAAIVVTLNRVNSIYNRELGINFTLHPNTDKLIYLDADTDPWNDADGNSILDVAQNTFDLQVPFASYHIGHVLSKGGGGVASTSLCDPSVKANGVTGSANPIGDFFDVDYVAHEIGHQLNADHTFNGKAGGCADNNGQDNIEIGSGSTIMGYAGICGGDNLQDNTDDYFSIASIKIIRDYITTGVGSTCGTVSGTINNLPTITKQTENGYVIPISTPFMLNGSGADPDGNPVTMNWEQVDRGTVDLLNDPIGNGPLFRSFRPSSSGIRYLPNLASLLSNTASKGEFLPTTTRPLNFSFNVRDSKGGVVSKITSISSTALAGPFEITSKHGFKTFDFSENVTVTWSVNNTDKAPVNCKFIDILMSADNGLNFDIPLALNTPNDGSQVVTMPKKASSACKIMIKAADHIFFATHKGFFTLVAPTGAYFSNNTSINKKLTCSPNDKITLTLDVNTFNGLSGNITYNVTSNNSFIVIDSPTGSFAATGTKTINISLNSLATTNVDGRVTVQLQNGSQILYQDYELNLYRNNVSIPVSLISPTNGEIDASLTPILQWQDKGINKYIVEVYQGATLFQKSDTLTGNKFKTSLLDLNTSYSWKVKEYNACANSESAQNTFTTGGEICKNYLAVNSLPLNMPIGTKTASSSITVSEYGTITSVRIIDLKGTHPYMTDLDISLTSPSNLKTLVLSDECNGNSGADYNLWIDEAAVSNIPCAPKNGNVYKPNTSFSELIGTDIHGTWTLTVEDFFPDVDAGKLDKWTLAFCVDKKSYPNQITQAYNSTETAKYTLSPNPVSQLLTIDGGYQGEVTIYNLLGLEIKRFSNAQTLEVSELAQGIYLAKLENGLMLNFLKD
jgi:subtilisin-like proprotein convertase family protein